MKLISFRLGEDERYGVYEEELKVVWDLVALEKERTGKGNLPSLLVEAVAVEDLEEKAKQWMSQATDEEKKKVTYHADEIEWLAPIPRPLKNIICIGKNYREHAIEIGGEESIPTDLLVFTKAPTTVIGHEQPVPAYEELTESLDYEGELAIIIGKKGKAISKEEALDHVFGFTIINDVTARDLQKRHKQFFLGKSLDGTCPMGPWIVTKSAIEQPGNLAIETKVNGEIRQQSNTSYFIFPLDEMISTLSKGMTLEPGDIIATGTPAGVGLGFNPPKLLKSGDVVEITIENVGTLRNRVQ
ncbi:MAG TPA: fumarylacetoacetate hydrolase family protein [Chondromyces sp.]|nr:fumarylacetoacetate hydrolase family protein [Chondromyces sp.]